MSDRDRLTITLKEDLLQRLDSIVDGVKIRNRSHAIEFLLSQSLTPKVTQAVILAGGEGVRLRPLTLEVPKCLIPVSGRPLIEYTIEMLREAGIRDIILATGHLGEKIEEELGNGKKFGIKIVYSKEKKPLGSGGALRDAKNLLLPQPFLVINADILTKINLTEFINFHQEDNYIATMALSNAINTKGYGTVLLRGEKILNFLKSGSLKPSQLIDAGIYIFNPEIFNFFPDKKRISLEEVFSKLAGEGKLAGFPFEGSWFEISTPKNYERAIKEWKK